MTDIGAVLGSGLPYAPQGVRCILTARDDKPGANQPHHGLNMTNLIASAVPFGLSTAQPVAVHGVTS